MLTNFNNLPDGILVRQMSYDAFVEENWPTILSPEEVERRDALTHPGRKKGFTLGRVALRTLLAERLNVTPATVPLQIEPSGQIVCPADNIHLSLAHSGEKALAAISSAPIGIDVEEVRTKPRSLLDHILGEAEREHILSLDLPESHRLFVCWTLKESVLKAMGIGLRNAPRKVLLTVDTNKKAAQIADPSGVLWQSRYVIEGNWVSAIAF